MGSTIACSLALLALVCAGPDAGVQPAAPLPGVEGPSAPLGRVGDAIEDVVPGGYPANEQVEVVTIEGCPRPQAFHLSRFVSGVAEGAAQVQVWLEGTGPGAPRGVEKRLFGKKKRLTEAVKRARRSAPSGEIACGPVAVLDGWKLALDRAPAKRCKPDGGAAGQGGDFLFVMPSDRSASALVRLKPAPAGRADRCRARLSAVLFDDSGRARLRYHADYGEALAVEVVGDGCEALELSFDAKTQTFRPIARKACTPAGR